MLRVRHSTHVHSGTPSAEGPRLWTPRGHLAQVPRHKKLWVHVLESANALHVEVDVEVPCAAREFSPITKAILLQ